MVTSIILAILASWRLASLLAEEEGPGEIFVRIRLGVTGKILGAKGASCVWCLSVYTGAFFAGLIYPFDFSPWYGYLIWWLGISGGTIIIHSILQSLIGGR